MNPITKSYCILKAHLYSEGLENRQCGGSVCLYAADGVLMVLLYPSQ